MALFSYLGLVIASMIGIVFFDDDIRSVSIVEWILLAVLVYSGLALAKILYQIYIDHEGL